MNLHLSFWVSLVYNERKTKLIFMIALIQKWRQTILMPMWNKNDLQRVKKKNQCDTADKTASACEFLFPLPPIITCSNMSFMNYLPQYVIICRVFRFMSPLSAIIIFYSSVSFYETPWYRITFILCLFITDLVAFGSSAQILKLLTVDVATHTI